MSASEALADALGLAFLAGPWTVDALVQRGSDVLGARPRWLVPLVREVVAQFPEAPNDASRRLSQTILD